MLCFEGSAQRGSRCVEFACFLKTLLLSLSCVCFCVQMPQLKLIALFLTLIQAHTSLKTTLTHTHFHICKCGCQHSVSQGFQSYFNHQGQYKQRSLERWRKKRVFQTNNETQRTERKVLLWIVDKINSVFTRQPLTWLLHNVTNKPFQAYETFSDNKKDGLFSTDS